MGDGYSTNDPKGPKTAMPGPQPQPIILTEGQKKMLEHLARRATSTQRLARRARIIVAAAEGYNNEQIADRLGINRETARLWRGVWLNNKERLDATEQAGRKELRQLIEEVLCDRPRSGAPPTFTPQQICSIVALACEDPRESGRPVTHWSITELADEAIKRGIVEEISARSVGRFLGRGGSEAPSDTLLAKQRAGSGA
jgi:transposase